MNQTELFKEIKKNLPHTHLSTIDILKRAKKLGIKYELVDREGKDFYFRLSYRRQRIYLKNNMLFRNINKISSRMAYNKDLSKQLLLTHQIKTPIGFTVTQFSEVKEKMFEHQIDFPLVIKPGGTDTGIGVVVNIQDDATARQAFNEISKIKHPMKNKPTIIEEYFSGNDYRLLVINGKFIACTERTFPSVTGDGQNILQRLIDQQLRTTGKDKFILDWVVKKNLARQGITLKTVIPKNKKIRLSEKANLSTGGIGINRTDEVCPKFKKIAEKCAKVLKIDACGVDIMTQDISQSKNDYRVIEVNHGPGVYTMHIKPDQGKSIDVFSIMLKEIFNIK